MQSSEILCCGEVVLVVLLKQAALYTVASNMPLHFSGGFSFSKRKALIGGLANGIP